LPDAIHFYNFLKNYPYTLSLKKLVLRNYYFYFIKHCCGIAAKVVLIVSFTGFSVFPVVGQKIDENSLNRTPRLSVKTNLLYDLTATISLGTEFRLARKITLDAPFHLNPWTINKEENSKFKLMLVQPGFRFWTCEAFNGHFIGVHGHYAIYNVSALPKPPFSETMNQNRFEGQLYGGGISYGFQWIIGKRWGLEFEIGGGYARLEYKQYPCQSCEKEFVEKTKNYLGVTRVGLNLMYHIF